MHSGKSAISLSQRGFAFSTPGWLAISSDRELSSTQASTASSSCAIACTWNQEVWQRITSTNNSQPCSRLVHEAADSGLLMSLELAAGINRVKGVRQLGFRSGNWLSAEQSSEVLKHPYGDSMRAKRDHTMLAMLEDPSMGIQKASVPLGVPFPVGP